MYAIHGTYDWSVRAVEVPLRAWSLNSTNVMVLRNENQVLVWNGLNTTQTEREVSKNFVTKSFGEQNVKFFEEGSEPEVFWKDLNAHKKEDRKYPVCRPPRRVLPRLFRISGASGVIKAEEILNFSQDDLEPDDVFILDAKISVFVWFGRLSSPSEQKVGMETAVSYVKTATDQRVMKTSEILKIKQGEEPATFTTHFHGWDYTVKQKSQTGVDSLQVNEDDLKYESGTPVEELLAEYTRKYTYNELVEKAYPKGTDVSKLETLLSDEEFTRVFEVNKATFYALPLWKQQGKKKELGLI